MLSIIKKSIALVCLLHAVGVYSSEKNEKTIVQLAKEIAVGDERDMFDLLTTGALSNDKKVKDFSMGVLSGWADLQKRELELRARPRIRYEEMQLVRTHGTSEEINAWYKNDDVRRHKDRQNQKQRLASLKKEIEEMNARDALDGVMATPLADAATSSAQEVPR